MHTLRAILVALVAASVAMLPVAGSMAQASSVETTLIADHSDCCQEGKSCDQQMPNGCGKIAACALQCFNFSGTIFSLVIANPVGEVLVQPAFFGVSLVSQPTAPPLPPPRF
jgi:hypothetical protein